MSNYVDVESMRTAANRMNEAADRMNSAANNMQGIVDHLERVNMHQNQQTEAFLTRFENALQHLSMD